MRRCRALLLLTLLLSGCWSRVELNDLGVVTAIAVDVGEQEAVRLTLYFARSPGLNRQSGGQTDAQMQVAAGVIGRDGPNLMDAMRSISLASPRRISLHHVRVVLIGQEYAHNHIADLTDFLARHPQIRMLSTPMVVLGKAQSVLEVQPHLETLQSENIYEILQAKGAREQRLKEFLIARASATHSGWMYTLRVVERPAREHNGAPERAVEVAGAALFLGDRPIEYLGRQEIRPLVWLLGNPRDMYVTVPCPAGGSGTYSLRVDEVQPSIRPTLQSGRVLFQVNVRLITELMRKECNLQAQFADDRGLLEAAASQQVKEIVISFIRRTQEAGVDPIGFGKHLQLAYPEFWRRIEKQWPKVWPAAEIRASADVRIRMSGLLIKPANKTEEELGQ